jgi:hypothetical protein
MTYATGTATDLEDLLSKLDTFAQTTHGGWASAYSPNPDTSNRWFELSKGSLSFSMRYPSGISSGETVSVHHATASAGSGVAPGAHTADSGNGYNVGSAGSSANFSTERCVSQMGNGPFPSYHFFADDVDEDYIHVVVEVQTGVFRHFGFGTLSKFGDGWAGGEYVYGHYQDQSTSALATDVNTQIFLDGLGATSDRSRAGTVRIASGMPNQGSAVWGVSAALAASSLLTDTAGNSRVQVHGGYRCGMAARGFGNVVGSGSLGYVGLWPIEAFYRDPSNPRVYYMGFMPDVRVVNVRNFSPAQEVAVGSDTWVVFPQSLRTTENVANRSAYSGVAYRKVV